MEIQPCRTCRTSSLGLHEFTSTQIFWINPLRISLNFLARVLVTRPIGTWIGSVFHLLVVPLSDCLSNKENFAIEHKTILTNGSNRTDLWHQKVGHVCEKGLDELYKRGLLGKEKLRNLEFCKHCVYGKNHRVKFSKLVHTTQSSRLCSCGSLGCDMSSIPWWKQVFFYLW